MKNRVLSFLLALALCLSLTPLTAMAANPSVTVAFSNQNPKLGDRLDITITTSGNPFLTLFLSVAVSPAQSVQNLTFDDAQVQQACKAAGATCTKVNGSMYRITGLPENGTSKTIVLTAEVTGDTELIAGIKINGTPYTVNLKPSGLTQPATVTVKLPTDETNAAFTEQTVQTDLKGNYDLTAVLAGAAKLPGYVLDGKDAVGLTGGKTMTDATVTFHYYADNKGGKADGIRDDCQLIVTFKVVNGQWNDQTTADKIRVYNKYTANTADLDPSGDAALLRAHYPEAGLHPVAGGHEGSWNVQKDYAFLKSDATYTYTYRAYSNVTLELYNDAGSKIHTAALRTNDLGEYAVTDELDAYRGTADGIVYVPDHALAGVTHDDLVIRLDPKPDANNNEIWDAAEATVTFRVQHGKWNDQTAADKTLIVEKRKNGVPAADGTALLTADQLPKAGSWGDPGYPVGGGWSPDPLTTPISGNASFAFTYRALLTLAYDGNGGTAPVSSSGLPNNGVWNARVTDQLPTRSGFTFLGWSKTAAAAAAEYQPGARLSLTENTTLYAVWQRSAYALTYTGSAQAALGAGFPADGPLQYSLDQTAWQNTVPTVTDAGSYKVWFRPSGSTGHNADDYAAVAVAPAAVTVTADSFEIYRGEALPTFTYTVTGLMSSDKLTAVDLRCTAANSEETGDFPITIAGCTLDNAANYTVTKVAGSLSIRRRSTVVTKYDVTVIAGPGGSVTTPNAQMAAGYGVLLNVSSGEGYELDALTAVTVSGKAVAISSVSGRRLFTMPAEAVTVTASFRKLGGQPVEPEAPVFTDVPADEYYAEAVRWAVEKGITLGATDTTFAPNAACTRGQIVTFLWRAAGNPEPAYAGRFTDVPSDAYYAKAVQWAVESGITLGVTDTAFEPETVCTRDQIVTFLWRAKGSPAGESGLPFRDVPADQWFTAAVEWAVDNGVTQGTSSDTFAPDAPCTRGQIVTFLWRAFNK